MIVMARPRITLETDARAVLAAEVERATAVAAMFADVHPNTQLRPDLAAAYLNCSVQTLAAWRFHGRGPTYYKIGRGVTYLFSDLQAFVHANGADPRAADALDEAGMWMAYAENLLLRWQCQHQCTDTRNMQPDPIERLRKIKAYAKERARALRQHQLKTKQAIQRREQQSSVLADAQRAAEILAAARQRQQVRYARDARRNVEAQLERGDRSPVLDAIRAMRAQEPS